MKNKSTEGAGGICTILPGPWGWSSGSGVRARKNPGREHRAPLLPNCFVTLLSPWEAVMTERQMVFALSQSPLFLRHMTLDQSLNLSRPQFPAGKYAEDKLPPHKGGGEA